MRLTTFEWAKQQSEYQICGGYPCDFATPVDSWPDEQRAIWEARLGRLDAYVTQLMKEREE